MYKYGNVYHTHVMSEQSTIIKKRKRLVPLIIYQIILIIFQAYFFVMILRVVFLYKKKWIKFLQTSYA